MPLPFFVTRMLVRTGLARHLPTASRLTGGHPDALRYYSDRVLAAPVGELRDPDTFPEPPAADVVDLNLAAPRFDSPVTGTRVAADRTGNPPAWGSPALRQALADTYRVREGRELDPHGEVLVTHGATGAYAAALDAFVNPGRKVVLFDPCSPLFTVGAKSRRATVRRVPVWNDNGRLRFDPDTLSRAMRGATLLALADPCNPTGGTLTAEDAEFIAWLAHRSDVLLYLDESFGRFRYDGPASRLFTLATGRTLAAGSLTQGYGLGSTRVGWLTGPRPLVQACALTASLAAPFIPTVCQQIASRAVQVEEDLFGPVLEEFRAKRRYATDRLRGMGFTCASPSGGFYVWASVSAFGMTGRAFADRLLREQRVRVGPGEVCGSGGTNFVRISFAAEDGRLREGLGRLAAFVTSLRGGVMTSEPRAEMPANTTDRPPAFSRV